MAEFASQLAAWQKGGARQDERAAAEIRRRYVERLGDSLAQSLDGGAFGEVEREFETAFAEGRKRSQERHENAAGDELLGEEERAATFAAATSDYELLRRPAVPLATRLGLIATQEQEAGG